MGYELGTEPGHETINDGICDGSLRNSEGVVCL